MLNLRPITPLSIIASNLDQLVTLVTSQDKLDPQTMILLEKTRDLAVELEPYLIKSTTKEEDSLKRLADRTLMHDWQGSGSDPHSSLEPEMLSGHVEGMFLRQIVSIANCKRILEIGLFSGYSALAMAQALPDDGRLVACEIDEMAAQFASKQFAQSDHGKKIDIRIGKAIDTLKKLSEQNHVFDLVFIDADKVGYKNYFEFLLEREMVKIGGIFLIDNTLLQGEPYLKKDRRSPGGHAIKEFNEYLFNEPRVEQVLLPIRDGVTFARRIA